MVIGDLATNTQLYLCYPAAGRGSGEREVFQMVAACVTVLLARFARCDQKAPKEVIILQPQQGYNRLAIIILVLKEASWQCGA